MLAGEALRSRSNDFNAALDALIDPSKRAGLTLAISLRIATEGNPQLQRAILRCNVAESSERLLVPLENAKRAGLALHPQSSCREQFVGEELLKPCEAADPSEEPASAQAPPSPSASELPQRLILRSGRLWTSAASAQEGSAQ
eukprot:scaffold126086_cov16-Tisochrysis_lutea.AAC.1